MMEDNIESWLELAEIEPPSADFEDSLIRRSYAITQASPFSLARLCREFHLPKPLYVSGAVAMAGLLLGLLPLQPVSDMSASTNETLFAEETGL